jgi:TRAP-type C4-dicarboxylate transport system substrate-binding protein
MKGLCIIKKFCIRRIKMKSSKYFLILVFFLALSFFVVFPADAAEITFKADHTGPPSKTESRAMEWMSNYIAKESMGRIKMDVFHLGTLCGRDAHVGFEMTMSGAIEMFIESNIMLVEWEPRYQVILFPFIFKGFDETYKLAKSPFAKEMASWVEPKGMTIIGWWTRPFRQLTNNRNPVRSPEDMKGMKVWEMYILHCN